MVGTSHYITGGGKMSVLENNTEDIYSVKSNVKTDKKDDLSRLCKLIADKKYFSARLLARKIRLSPSPFRDDANFWYEYKMIVSRQNKSLSKHIDTQIVSCKNYSSLMYEHILRSDILYAIRNHKIEEAKTILRRYQEMPSYNEKRISTTKAVGFTLEGKIAYAYHDYGKAVERLTSADFIWRKLRSSPKNKWQTEARFYLLKAVAAKKEAKNEEETDYSLITKICPELIFSEVLNMDINGRMRFRAYFINIFGRFGNKIDDLLM